MGSRFPIPWKKNSWARVAGIQNAIHHFEEPFFVLSSDIWTDFESFNNLELKNDFLAHMILIPNPKSNPKGDVSLIDGYIRSDPEEINILFQE